MPAEEDIKWDPAFEDMCDALVTKKGDKSEADLARGKETGRK